MPVSKTISQYDLISELYQLNRNIISDGYDEALSIISGYYPLTTQEYPTGSKCWTWTIPEKWTCEEAYIKDSQGNILVNYADNPLHLASYSEPLNRKVPHDELMDHLFTHPHLDHEIPFIFYYYQKNWAFCVSKDKLKNFRDTEYEVVINSRRESGTLKTGEWFLQGEQDECFTFCTHLDHPMQVNDGLSGVTTCLDVMSRLSSKEILQYSYRLLIVPETIGSLAWLSHNEDKIPGIIGGMFVEMTGLDLPPAMQSSYKGDSLIDKLFRSLHLESEENAWAGPYRSIVGNDERQFNAPGVRVPMLSYARCHKKEHPQWPFAEYHSPADNPDITHEGKLNQSADHIYSFIEALEANYYPLNKFRGEVFLTGYGISVDRNKHLRLHQSMLRIMEMIDGTNSVLDIAETLDLKFRDVTSFLDSLYENDLIEKLPLFAAHE